MLGGQQLRDIWFYLVWLLAFLYPIICMFRCSYSYLSPSFDVRDCFLSESKEFEDGPDGDKE